MTSIELFFELENSVGHRNCELELNSTKISNKYRIALLSFFSKRV